MEFVNFEIAKKLKEKGYPQVKKNTIAMYNEDGDWYSLSTTLDDFYYVFEDFDEHDYVCPTIPQALKWLREEKKYHIKFDGNAFGYLFIVSDIPSEGGTDRYCSYYKGPNDGGCWDTYEEAALAGIEYVLDNLIAQIIHRK